MRHRHPSSDIISLSDQLLILIGAFLVIISLLFLPIGVRQLRDQKRIAIVSLISGTILIVAVIAYGIEYFFL